jgi:PAS domain S-box-containing protein
MALRKYKMGRKQENVEAELLKRTHDLGESVKELNCLYGLSKLIEKPEISIDQVFAGIIELIPPSWQYPDICAAKITCCNKEYKTANYKVTSWTQSSDIKKYGEKIGAIEVTYLQEKPVIDEGPFLKEERLLINALSERLGKVIERLEAEKSLKENEEKYRTLFETMAQGVVWQNAEGYIFSANPAAENILGLTIDQMQGRTSIDPRWKSVHKNGSDFPGDTHPSMVALKTGKKVSNVIMGVFNPKVESYKWININAVPQFKPGEDKPYQVYTTFEDITKSKNDEKNLEEAKKILEEKNVKLRQALSEIKTLSGLLPICSNCKKIRDDKGYWQQVEVYVRDHTDAEFSHSICPECKVILYPELYEELKPKSDK